MNKRIVYTRFDGGVSICCPSDECITWMGCGGYWNGFPRGFVDIQIERQIEAGHLPDAARRFAHALQFGGHTTAEALEIIRDRDCAYRGTAIELWDVENIPTDRWFRDAWRRSPNGGPICIDLEKARPIQFGHIRAAMDLTDSNHMDLLRERIRTARDEYELRLVWPTRSMT